MDFDWDVPEGADREEWARRTEAEFQRRWRGRDFPAMRYAIKRFVVRTARMATGSAILILSFWPIGYALDTLSTPFSSLSPLGLILALLAGFVALVLLGAAFTIAFGEGESRELYEASLEGEMRVAVGREFRAAHERALADQRQPSAAYKAGRAAGRLLKP